MKVVQKKFIMMQNIHEKCGQGLKVDLEIGKIKMTKMKKKDDED